MLSPDNYPHGDGAFTSAEVISFAYGLRGSGMDQDWNVALGHTFWGPLMFDLIEDKCSERRFCLSVLYAISGRTAPTLRDELSFDNPEERALNDLLVEAERRNHPWLLTWATRTRALIGHPERFYRGQWFDGGYAGKPTGPRPSRKRMTGRQF